MSRRTKPYTAIGVTRVTCAVKGCTNRGAFDWRICADGQHRAICVTHDVELNEMVMRWAFGKTRERDLAKYRAEKLGT